MIRSCLRPLRPSLCKLNFKPKSKPFKMSGTDNSGWLNSWEEDKTAWHIKNVHPMLEKYVDKIIAGREACRIFFPLCGKAVDMKWLADKGHTVVGIELSSKALTEFFQEQKVEYDVSPVEGVADAELYKSKDGKLMLYKGDLFGIPRDILGKFDGMWDRGSLVAINKTDRERYADLMVSSMNPDCKYLLSTFDYDPAVMSGPPNCVPDAEVQRLYGNSCNLEILEKDENSPDKAKLQHAFNLKLAHFVEVWYMVTLSQASS